VHGDGTRNWVGSPTSGCRESASSVADIEVYDKRHGGSGAYNLDSSQSATACQSAPCTTPIAPVTAPPAPVTAAPEPEVEDPATNPGVVAVAGPPVTVLIDSSGENTKCVTASGPVICAGDAGHLGNRINSHQAGDTFEITTNGAEVCATRTDYAGGWGMHLEIACVAAPVHILIDSSNENTKCVTHTFPVSCAGDAGHLGNRINSHQAGDTFEITTDGAEVCARRTDNGPTSGWGMHLEIACVATDENEIEGPIVSAPSVQVLIDDSSDNIKCVETSVPVICAGDAGHLGNRINSHQAGDTFEITTSHQAGYEVCARRTDSNGGWGMHLEITCVAAPVHVLIDSSSENTKCVTSSLPVHCADDAGHLGNRVNSHQAADTFEITTDGLEVCARRTDNGPTSGWGMHLEIACVAVGEAPPLPAPEPTLPPVEWFLPSDWTIEASTIWSDAYNADRVKVTDGTPWHSRGSLPEYLIFDAGEVVMLDAFATVHPVGWSGAAMREYTLSVSDDGASFTQVQQGIGADLGNSERQDIEFPATASRYWKLEMTNHYGYHTFVAIQYLEFRTSAGPAEQIAPVVPEPTLPPVGWTLPTDWSISASTIWSDAYEAARVKVQDGTPWHSRGTLPEHLIFDAGQPVTINGIATAHPVGWAGSAMQDYSFLRSDDGVEFTEVTSGVGANLGNSERQEIEFAAVTARFWKLAISTHYGYHTFVTVQYIEFSLTTEPETQWCADGIFTESNGVCCADSCGSCGGSGCGSRPGGGDQCCHGSISAQNRVCEDVTDVACVVPNLLTIQPVVARNCWDHLQHDPAAQDGIYAMTNGDSLINAYCDMENGGWTLVHNIPGNILQDEYVSTDALPSSFSPDTASAELLAGGSFFKFSDADVNSMAGEDPYFKWTCGNADIRGLYRVSGWTSLRDQGDWEMDRNFDGVSDCTANRPNYIFADYPGSGGVTALTSSSSDCNNPQGCDDTVQCGSPGHINYGEASGRGGCYHTSGGWGQTAQVWVRGSE